MRKTLHQLTSEIMSLANKYDHRVMVIEDLVEAQQHLRRSLRAVGFQKVDLFNTAEDALKALGAIRYNVVFCDMNLPGMSGGAFLDKVRGSGLLAPHSIFFMVSGEVHVESIKKLLTQAPDEYIAKPFNQELLWRKLLKNLKLRDDRLKKNSTS